MISPPVGERVHLHTRLDFPAIDPDLKPDEIRLVREGNVERAVIGIGLIQIRQGKRDFRRDVGTARILEHVVDCDART